MMQCSYCQSNQTVKDGRRNSIQSYLCRSGYCQFRETHIEAIQQSLVENFGDIKDPRVERTKKHQLTDILVMAIQAVIAVAQGCEDIENYGISKQQWLEEF
jgi:hypothetical protein